jgi:Domain of unknown function (DUF1840)
MLVRFHSDAGNLTMFGDVAVKLLKMMGHSGTVPSAILPKDIPSAVARLEAALQIQAPNPSGDEGSSESREPPVSLRSRAHPLIDLLKRAAERDVQVMWK